MHFADMLQNKPVGTPCRVSSVKDLTGRRKYKQCFYMGYDAENSRYLFFDGTLFAFSYKYMKSKESPIHIKFRDNNPVEITRLKQRLDEMNNV